MYRFIAEHKTGVKFIISPLAALLVTIVLYIMHCSVYVIFVVDFFVSTAICLFADLAQNKVVMTALRAADEMCDPTPFLLETEWALSLPNSDDAEQLLQINHAAALSMLGDDEAAYDELSMINIDKFRVAAAVRITYYNNLSEAADGVGRFDEASLCYAKLAQLFRDLRHERDRRKFEASMNDAWARECFRRGDYEEMLTAADAVMTASRRQEVGRAMLHAKAFLGLGDVEAAISCLDYVIAYGNRLGDARRAAEMKARISK